MFQRKRHWNARFEFESAADPVEMVVTISADREPNAGELARAFDMVITKVTGHHRPGDLWRNGTGPWQGKQA